MRSSLAKSHPAALRLLAVALVVCFSLTIALPALAAAMAEEHTVLYYLIETQRRYKKTCGGTAMPEAPSLTPSSSLREFSEVAGGQDPANAASAWGLTGTPYAIASASGGTPQQAFDALLNGGQCDMLMGQQYKYIGASRSGNRWTVVLSGTQPKAAPVAATPLPVDSYRPGQPQSGEAAAAPQVVGSVRLDASGKIIGNVEPGTSALPARPSAPDNLDAANQRPRTGVTPLSDTRSPAALGESSDNSAFGIFANEGLEVSPQPTVNADSAPGLVPLGLPGSTQAPRPADNAPVTSGSHASQAAKAATPAPTSAARASAGEMLAMVNTTRAKARRCGSASMAAAPKLVENSSLTRAAQTHARLMRDKNFFSSLTPEGETLGKRVSATGYNWSFVAENIAGKVASPDSALDSWLEKEDQCSNIMGPEYTQFGAAYEPEGHLWVLILATPMQ
ncbi:CAP domain-containing protein [Desulfovibrio sp. OttesenSCG-928-G15]|nr:CAP domain-containing protein [Desulfovibrio sp. OttesenSCG-928-G15]